MAGTRRTKTVALNRATCDEDWTVERGASFGVAKGKVERMMREIVRTAKAMLNEGASRTRRSTPLSVRAIGWAFTGLCLSTSRRRRLRR